MNKVALYTRVSTQEQADEGYSIGEQRERLEAYCLARDWTISEVYVDPGFTGSNLDRPALKKLVKDARANKMDTVLVYKLDRLSRSQKDTLFLIEDVFNKNDVSFVSVNENFDTSSAFGRAMIGILSVFAQLEREQIKERTMMGKLARAKEGYFHGGPYAPVGYNYIDGELVVNEYEAMQVRKIFELFLGGWAISRIHSFMQDNYTTQHGNWASSNSVYSVLTTPICTGTIRYMGVEYHGRHTPIIDRATYDRSMIRFKAIQWKIEDHPHESRPFQGAYLLSGMLICGHCGAGYFVKGNYSGHPGKKVYRPYYTCYSRGKSNPKMQKDPDCKNKSYATVDLDRIIIDEIRKLTFDSSYVAALKADAINEDPSKDINTMESRISDIDKQIARLLDLYQMGTIDAQTILTRVGSLTDEKESLEEQIESFKDLKPTITIKEAQDLVASAGAILDGDDLSKKRSLVQSLISVIELVGDDQVIHWAFI